MLFEVGGQKDAVDYFFYLAFCKHQKQHLSSSSQAEQQRLEREGVWWSYTCSRVYVHQ